MMTRVEIDEEARRVTTTFADGSHVVAEPNYDDESRARAVAIGYQRGGPDVPAVWDMTKDHERLHTLLAEAQGYPVSTALWHAAHPDDVMTGVAKIMASTEERAVLLIQRLLNEGLEAVWDERQASC